MERIDVHAHCLPPAYREYCLQNEMAGRGHPDGMPAMPEWSVESHLDLMKRLGITKSILSISSPGTHLTPGNDKEGRDLTRRVNTDISQICAAHPQQLLFFASLPLPDVEGSLAEIDYALDHLGAFGFQILSNSQGLYPGDPRFAPVWDKLNERKAVVFMHPTTCHVRSETGDVVTDVMPQPGVPSPVVEFMFESTRGIMSLLNSGTLRRCPSVTIVACHCAGTLPPVLQRIVEFGNYLRGGDNRIEPSEVKNLLATRFYFDLAGMPFPDQIHGLLRIVDTSRLLYGSDYPYTPAPLVEAFAAAMDKGLATQLGSDVRERVLSKNAMGLLERAARSSL